MGKTNVYRITKQKKQDLSYFSTFDLTPASENMVVYDGFVPHSDDDDYSLYTSIKEEGIREPLHISADHFILSGHRRYAVACRLELSSVPCIRHDDIVYGNLTPDERLKILAAYNRQRDKSYAERLRETMLEINPENAHNQLIFDRRERNRIKIEPNIVMGEYKSRARITTIGFLEKVQWVIEAERNYWPLTVRRIHYLLLNDPPLRHDKKTNSTYHNHITCYKALSSLCTRARITGDIPWGAIEDETRPIRVVATYQNPADFIREQSEDFLTGYARDLLRGQRLLAAGGRNQRGNSAIKYQ